MLFRSEMDESRCIMNQTDTVQTSYQKLWVVGINVISIVEFHFKLLDKMPWSSYLNLQGVDHTSMDPMECGGEIAAGIENTSLITGGDLYRFLYTNRVCLKLAYVKSNCKTKLLKYQLIYGTGFQTM